MLWGRGNVPATPGQLRALFDDPLCKKLIYQLWTAQALAKLGGDAQGDPEDPLSLSDLTDRQMGMIDEAAEAIDRECIPYDVDKLVPTDPPCPQLRRPFPLHRLSKRLRRASLFPHSTWATLTTFSLGWRLPSRASEVAVVGSTLVKYMYAL